MARGWESKSVEEQQATSLTERQGTSEAPSTPEQVEQQRQRQGLTLSRRHLLAQLEVARHPSHRCVLTLALADLDARLSRVD